MLYANVVLGLPIEGPFDYIVPAVLEKKIALGARVRVNFRNKKEVAYVVGLNNKTKIKKVKEILALIDTAPALNNKMLLLTKRLAQYYCCSWGEAIETALCQDLRKVKEIGLAPLGSALPRAFCPRSLLAAPGNDGIASAPAVPRNDEVVMASGNDGIASAPAVPRNDEVVMAPGNDEVVMAPGNDEVVMASRNDEVVMAPRNDEVVMAPGNDGIASAPTVPRNDEVVMAPGNDEVVMAPRNDEVVAVPRNDEVVAVPRNDEVVAVPRNDGYFFIQGQDRLPRYLKEIKEILINKKSAIILFSDIGAVNKAKEEIQNKLGIEAFVSFRKQPQELKTWEKIREKDYCLVIGTRSAIFSPVNNLGLIIVDQEDDQVYKQEQVPHYHARTVALMRAEIENAKVMLASNCLSLESYYLAQKNNLPVEFIPYKNQYPQVKVIDARRVAYSERKNKPLFSKFLTDAIYTALLEKEKILLVINRTGFATTAACHNCGLALKCPRCNINLVLHFDQDQLKCHHCNFKMEVPKICPSCKAGYIKYSGIGVEKIESELARIFPQAKKGDITITTSSILKHPELNFDLIGVLAIDNSLNRMDFRASEKTFSLLTGLVGLTSKKIIIQSANANHYCFQALIKNDPQLFYRQELKQRKQLNFAPFKHMILLKLRCSNLDKVKQAANDLFQKLNKLKTSSIKILSLNCGQPAKLRGNFYYQILMRASNVEKASHFLKLHLKNEHYSGIIVTVDVDPV